ncbi:MAG: histidine kinase, partial [Bacteroides sp.]|nr:histidine kinase [Bacteroides sp.]
DNGGGFRLNSGNRGTGTGMKVIMQTIQILNAKNKETIEVSVHNVDLPSGEVGCEICFHLPLNYDYSIL